jgi:hypothetical protein
LWRLFYKGYRAISYLMRRGIRRSEVKGEGISRVMRSASCPPACGLRLDLRKAHHPTDSARLEVFDRLESPFLAVNTAGFECAMTKVVSDSGRRGIQRSEVKEEPQAGLKSAAPSLPAQAWTD